MSEELDYDLLVGEMGDVWIHQDYTEFDFLHSNEIDRNYRHLDQLPASFQAYIFNDINLILITHQGQLVLFNIEYPLGVLIQFPFRSIGISYLINKNIILIDSYSNAYRIVIDKGLLTPQSFQLMTVQPNLKNVRSVADSQLGLIALTYSGDIVMLQLEQSIYPGSEIYKDIIMLRDSLAVTKSGQILQLYSTSHLDIHGDSIQTGVTQVMRVIPGSVIDVRITNPVLYGRVRLLVIMNSGKINIYSDQGDYIGQVEADIIAIRFININKKIKTIAADGEILRGDRIVIGVEDYDGIVYQFKDNELIDLNFPIILTET